MPKLADFMPKNHPVVDKIYDNWKRTGDSEKARAYLGASIIGHPCERYLWFLFRGACKENMPGRIFRLLDHGDREEERIVADLRAAGCTVHDFDPNTGEQFEVNALDGHFSGHMDACLCGLLGSEKTWHVGEFKTCNDKWFNKLLADGVQKVYPKHYAQIQAYMHHTGMKRALYVAVNKNTDEIWAERVYYDKVFCEAMMEKAKRIIFSNDLPSRLSERPDWWECSFCSAKHLCHGTGDVLPVPAINCRQCCHATPVSDGNARWECSKRGCSLSMEDQERACDKHLLIPHLLTGYDVEGYGKDEETGDDFIVYKDDEGREFTNGTHHPGIVCYSSGELRALSRSALSSDFLQSAKGIFGATVTGCSKAALADRYPVEDSEVCWKGPLRDLKREWERLFGVGMDDDEMIEKEDTFEYKAAEFSGGRLAIVWSENNVSEIRRGKA